MFNPRISGIAAGAGFILSFLLGIITGASFPLVLTRALVFAAVFFALVSAGYWAIGKYLPDLLDTVLDSGGEAPRLGAQVDISVGDDDARAGDGEAGDGLEINPDISITDESGGFDEFIENPDESGGDVLDQNDEDGYTALGDLDAPPLNPALPGEMDLSAGEGGSADGLPDLDRMSGAFGSGAGSADAGGESPAGGLAGGLASVGSLFDVESKAEKKGLEGEFAGKNVQEMASAIQTILKRDNKG
jgi:hypothetical protein